MLWNKRDWTNLSEKNSFLRQYDLVQVLWVSVSAFRHNLKTPQEYSLYIKKLAAREEGQSLFRHIW